MQTSSFAHARMNSPSITDGSKRGRLLYILVFINILATLRLPFDFAQDRLFSVTVMLSGVEAYAI